MNATRSRTNLAIILKLDSAASSSSTTSFVAHLVVNRFALDDDGNVCLTIPAGLDGLLASIDELKAELDGLANDAILWLAGSIALRCARTDFIRQHCVGQRSGVVGDGDSAPQASPSPSPSRAPGEVIRLLPKGT